ncbi:hypothetical protein BDV59DRAFT_190926 [Aspergillus ambiguus]|uniref:heme-dependent oxidative N-demethylase family protein n=1 Tax=Aspergillus ambiguus TaxID=176160 RepID=UPI003CCD89B9
MAAIMETVASLALYVERNPLWIVGLVLGIWALGFWSRGSPANDTGYPPIEPLPDFDWRSTEPLSFRPFKPKYHLTMALSNLDVSTLIPMDKTYQERIALRTSLLREHPDVVIGVNPIEDARIPAAIRELYVFIVGTYLPTRYPTMFRLTQDKIGQAVLENLALAAAAPVPLHPDPHGNGRAELELLSTLVDEDLLILLPSEETTDEGLPKYVLQAYTTFFPAGFDTRTKLGRRLADIHLPVPGYAAKLERSMDRFFARVEVGKFVQRVNWSITTQTELFAAFGGIHGAEGEEKIAEGKLDIDSTVLRCERQTLHRLPHTKGLVFAFHTYTYPLRTVKDQGLGEELAAAIDGLKEGSVPEMHWYKRGSIWGDAVKHFLRS